MAVAVAVAALAALAAGVALVALVAVVVVCEKRKQQQHSRLVVMLVDLVLLLSFVLCRSLSVLTRSFMGSSLVGKDSQACMRGGRTLTYIHTFMDTHLHLSLHSLKPLSAGQRGFQRSR